MIEDFGLASFSYLSCQKHLIHYCIHLQWFRVISMLFYVQNCVETHLVEVENQIKFTYVMEELIQNLQQ